MDFCNGFRPREQLAYVKRLNRRLHIVTIRFEHGNAYVILRPSHILHSREDGCLEFSRSRGEVEVLINFAFAQLFQDGAL